NLIVIEGFEIKNPKTKDFLSVLSSLGLIENRAHAKTLIVDSLDNANLVLSSRNVKKTKITNSFGLNIYDLIYHEKLLISKAAVEELVDLLDPKREGSKEEVASETLVEAKPKAKKEAKPTAAATDAGAPTPKKAAKKAVKEDKAETTEEAADNE
ncbi:MAG: 50S ribosomal protein L4, partial [Acidobacteriota bacterium]